jgi:hypothetical protein
VAELFGLHPAADGVEPAVGESYEMKRVDHLGGVGQDHRVASGVGGRRVEGTDADALFPCLRPFFEPAGYIDVVPPREDVDYLVVL